MRNAYPDRFIDSDIAKFMSDLKTEEKQFKLHKCSNTKKKQLVVTEFDDVYITIPYIENHHKNCIEKYTIECETIIFASELHITPSKWAPTSV